MMLGSKVEDSAAVVGLQVQGAAVSEAEASAVVVLAGGVSTSTGRMDRYITASATPL